MDTFQIIDGDFIPHLMSIIIISLALDKLAKYESATKCLELSETCLSLISRVLKWMIIYFGHVSP